MKNKKKVQLFSFFIVLTIIFLGAIYLLDKDTVQNEATTMILGDSSQMYEMKNLGDIVKYSDNVILGTVIGNEEIDEYQTRYTVSVNKSLKGSLDSTDIDVYEAKNTLQLGKQYMLFLGYFDSPLYPRELYSSIEKDCIIEIENGEIISENKFVEKGNALENIIKNIEKSPSVKYQNNNKEMYSVKNKYNNLEDLIEASDHIVQISVNEVTRTNKFVSLVQANVTQQFKGDMAEEYKFIMPSDLETEKEYLLFLTRRNDDTLTLTSREGSIIYKDNLDEWNKTIDALLITE